MADSFTSNLGLILPDLNDGFNFGSHVIPNFGTIDGMMGAVSCLTTARPAITYTGQIAYERDSGRYIQNTGTKASPVWTYMSHAAIPATNTALPTSGLSTGMLVYETDTFSLAFYSGGGWHFASILNVTSSTRPVGGALASGATIYETDTKRLLVYNGTSWEQKAFSNFVCTSSAHPSAPFQGLEIYETDTGLNGVYNGSSYLYGAQQVASTQVVGSTTSAVTFSSIPPVTRLLVTWRARTTGAAADMRIKLDNDGSSGHYTWYKNSGRTATMTVSGSSSDSGASIGVAAGTTTANYYSNGFVIIDGWNTSTGYATYSGVSSGFDSATSYWIEQYGGLYNAAVGPHNRLDLYIISSGSIAAGSQFSVYALP